MLYVNAQCEPKRIKRQVEFDDEVGCWTTSWVTVKMPHATARRWMNTVALCRSCMQARRYATPSCCGIELCVGRAARTTVHGMHPALLVDQPSDEIDQVVKFFRLSLQYQIAKQLLPNSVIGFAQKSF